VSFTYPAPLPVHSFFCAPSKTTCSLLPPSCNSLSFPVTASPLFITYGHGQVNRRSTAVYIDHPPPASWREGIISRILVCILLLSPLFAPPLHLGFVTTSRNSRPRQPCYHPRLRPPISLFSFNLFYLNATEPLSATFSPTHPHLPSPIFQSGLILQSRYKIRRTLIRAIGRLVIGPMNCVASLRGKMLIAYSQYHEYRVTLFSGCNILS
jgi:hypothetical protein